jgi:FdhD protein
MLTSEPLAQVERPVTRVQGEDWVETTDRLAGEEPMEIRLRWRTTDAFETKSIAVTMRTPGDDFELAVGFLFGEGIIVGRDDFIDIAYCLEETEEQRRNVVTVELRPGVSFDLGRLDRHFYTTSSCGVCGKAALNALEIRGCQVLPNGLEIRSEIVPTLPGALRDAQGIFQTTGGLHAAGLFDIHGQLLDLREDVGRHNAVDKLIGNQLMRGRTVLDEWVLMLSGRASFELIQKALTARIPIVAAVGAPSSLAVELAEAYGMTLLGFVRPTGFVIYSGAQRVQG